MKERINNNREKRSEANNAAQAEAPKAEAVAAPVAEVVEEPVDFSKVQIESLFADCVDFETFSKSDFKAVVVLIISGVLCFLMSE